MRKNSRALKGGVRPRPILIERVIESDEVTGVAVQVDSYVGSAVLSFAKPLTYKERGKRAPIQRASTVHVKGRAITSLRLSDTAAVLLIEALLQIYERGEL